MPNDDFDIYRNLQLHLDQFPIGFPAIPTGIELKVLKHLFTEKEAIIATKMSWLYDPEQPIQLKKREEEIIPPQDTEDLYNKIMDKKQQLRKK